MKKSSIQCQEKQEESPKLVETSTGKREWKARFQVTPFTDTVDEITRKALETICPERKVVLHFSTGKDSVAAWLTLREMGFEVVPVYKEIFPNLRIIDEVINAYEDYFKTEVIKIPDNGIFSSLCNYYGPDFQTLEFMQIKNSVDTLKGRHDIDDEILNITGCNIAIVGTKGSDSINRRTNFQMSGPYNPEKRVYSLCWRLRKNAPLDIIVAAKCPIPRYYSWLARSPEFLFDSEYWFVKRYYPDDWDKIINLLPGAEIRVKNFECSEKPRILQPLKSIIKLKDEGYQMI